MIWMARATSKDDLRAASHRHNMVCNREFGGSCAALSPWQSQSRWVLEWRYCPWWNTAGFQAAVNQITAHFKWCIQLKGHRFFCEAHYLNIPVSNVQVMEVFYGRADVVHDLWRLWMNKTGPKMKHTWETTQEPGLICLMWVTHLSLWKPGRLWPECDRTAPLPPYWKIDSQRD